MTRVRNRHLELTGLTALSLGLVVLVLATAGVPELGQGTVSAASVADLMVTGVAVNQSSARVYFQPVAGARDYRVYDVTAPTDVKYAGMAHLVASATCPGSSCLNHFEAQADGVTPVFPYRTASGASSGPQALDVPATDIEWNSLGDGQPHTLVVEAVDQAGPVPQANLYSGQTTSPLVSPLPAGAMLGSDKGPTTDGHISTNGQGPYTNQPQVIARSEPFVAQANSGSASVPSRADATQVFYDTFDNPEGATIAQVSRQDSPSDTFGNLGSMTYSLNAGTQREWDIEFRGTDNSNSMPFISSDHFMDMLFDGATPGVSAPGHTLYGSMSMTPKPTLDISHGEVLHLTMEVDAHQSFRRWMGFDLAPASDPLRGWDPVSQPINNADQGLFMEFRDGGCTLDIYSGAKSASDHGPAGTAGGSHGARLWGGAGSVGGAPIMCGWDQTYNTKLFTRNGLGLDDRSRLDFFLSQNHAALFQDGQLVVQSDIPAGSFAWATGPLKAYYSHYLYHSDADIVDLVSFQSNGAGYCYPLNVYWFNDALTGTPASKNVCKTAYPAGYGFPHSDERHWDNMGFEVLPASAVPANNDFSGFGASVQPPQAQAPQFVAGDLTYGALIGSDPQVGQWANVTPPTASASDANAGGCGNFGASSVVVDPALQSNLYAHFDCQGIWKSTDFGLTWTGPINTGANGAGANGAGTISIAPGPAGGPPILYSGSIRGTGTGFWKSVDDGVSWTQFVVGPPGTAQDAVAPVVDPDDGNHLVRVGHETSTIYESVDGGQTWAPVHMEPGMSALGSGALTFVNTGKPASTRTTWLWMAQGTAQCVGTWRTTDGGAHWTRVECNEHGHGGAQFYQPGATGVIYMPGVYGSHGWGVYRSTDYGVTWTHVGDGGQEAIVFGTPNNVYSGFGWSCQNCTADANLQGAPQPGTTGWTRAATNPAGMAMGPVSAAVVFDGTHSIVVTANMNSGLWRYIEPGSGTSPSPAAQTATPVPTAVATPVPTAVTPDQAPVEPGDTVAPPESQPAATDTPPESMPAPPGDTETPPDEVPVQ